VDWCLKVGGLKFRDQRECQRVERLHVHRAAAIGAPILDPQEIPRRLDRFASDVVLKRLNRFGDFGRIETELEVAVPGLAPDPGSAAETLVMRLAGCNKTETVPFGTEAGHYQAAGIPTVVCGPGSINQAHQPDEYITLEQFEAGLAFMRRLAQACKG
jgi:acetylornithine deacetylase